MAATKMKMQRFLLLKNVFLLIGVLCFLLTGIMFSITLYQKRINDTIAMCYLRMSHPALRRRGDVAATLQRRLSVRPSDVVSTSQTKHPTTSRWNVAKTSQWCVSTTSYWNVITTSQKDVTTTPRHYVSTTSQASLK